MQSNIEYLNESLNGSPYSIPVDALGFKKAEYLMDQCGSIFDQFKVAQELFSQQQEEIQRSIHLIIGSQEVYESNKLELTGLSLELTHAEIRKLNQNFQSLKSYVAKIAISADKSLVDVLGLHTASVFAREIANDFIANDAPLREIDIRNLHKSTLPNETWSGSYRTEPVTISGSKHEPPEHLDVPRAMSELVEWLNTTSAPPPLAAAVAHSWLTIIHPFKDGNGRVARLLATLVLMRHNYPPLIIRHKDKLQYLDALAASDSGGDLLALFELFVLSIRYVLRTYSDTDQAKRLFEADLAQDPELRYHLWSKHLIYFVDKLRNDLKPHFTVDRLSVPPPSTLILLENLKSTGNTWLAKVKNKSNTDILLWLGFPTRTMRDNWNLDPNAPSIFLSQRDTDIGAIRPYKQLNELSSSGLVINEISLVASPDHVHFIRVGLDVQEKSLDEIVAALVRAINQFSDRN